MSFSNGLIAFLLAILPALAWLFFYYHKDYRDPEPKVAIAQTFLAGILMGIPFLLVRFLLENIPNMGLLLTGFSSVLLFAILEELAKLSASIFVVIRHKIEFNQIIDGVVYAVV